MDRREKTRTLYSRIEGGRYRYRQHTGPALGSGEEARARATSGNRAADGREVLLTGYVTPTPPETDGIATAYLVPERGMCSHVPPPSPNQMLGLRLPGGRQPQTIYQGVGLAGKLTIAPCSRMVRVVDGLVPMRATFSMDVSQVETLAGRLTQEETPSLSLKDRLLAARR